MDGLGQLDLHSARKVAASICSAAKSKAKAVSGPVRTATASSPPARPASGSRSPAATRHHGRSGSGPSSTPLGRSPAASAAKTSNPRTPATN